MYRRAPFPRIFLLNPYRRFIWPDRGTPGIDIQPRNPVCFDRFQTLEKIIGRYCGRALKRVAETVNTAADRYIEGVRYRSFPYLAGKLAFSLISYPIETVDHVSLHIFREGIQQRGVCGNMFFRCRRKGSSTF